MTDNVQEGNKGALTGPFTAEDAQDQIGHNHNSSTDGATSSTVVAALSASEVPPVIRLGGGPFSSRVPVPTKRQGWRFLT